MLPNTVVVQYGQTQWSFNMDKHSGRSIWTNTVVVQYVQTQWSFNMYKHSGRSICTNTVVVQYGQTQWSFNMYKHSGRSIWTNTVVVQYVQTQWSLCKQGNQHYYRKQLLNDTIQTRLGLNIDIKTIPQNTHMMHSKVWLLVCKFHYKLNYIVN